jgi:hypothetical protein
MLGILKRLCPQHLIDDNREERAETIKQEEKLPDCFF